MTPSLCPSELPGPSREGAHILRLYVDCARWDDDTGSFEESRLREVCAKMPVVRIKAAQHTGIAAPPSS